MSYYLYQDDHQRSHRQCDRQCNRQCDRQCDRHCSLQDSSAKGLCLLTLSWPMALTSSRRACRGTMHWGEAAASTPTSIALMALFHILHRASPCVTHPDSTQTSCSDILNALLCCVVYKAVFHCIRAPYPEAWLDPQCLRFKICVHISLSRKSTQLSGIW